MPFILQNQVTGVIASCILTNVYDLEYYGVKWWESLGDAIAQQEEFLKAAEMEDIEVWSVIEVTEQRLKIMNVKLNNNPDRKIYIDKKGAISLYEN